MVTAEQCPLEVLIWGSSRSTQRDLDEQQSVTSWAQSEGDWAGKWRVLGYGQSMKLFCSRGGARTPSHHHEGPFLSPQSKPQPFMVGKHSQLVKHSSTDFWMLIHYWCPNCKCDVYIINVRGGSAPLPSNTLTLDRCQTVLITTTHFKEVEQINKIEECVARVMSVLLPSQHFL